MNRRPLAAAAALVLVTSLTACAGERGPGGAELAGDEITVFAAASLSFAFEEIGKQFTEETGIGVTFSYAGSQDLVAQVLEGAPADVLATADELTMQRVVTEAPELVEAEPRSFATNTLIIATPPGNRAGVTSWADLADDDLALVMCAPEVPCGASAKRVEAATGVRLHPVSEESNVSDVLAKVVAGEADAGLVYETDIVTAKVDIVPCPECIEDKNTYQAAPLAGAHPEAARAFIDFLVSEIGTGVLLGLGFGDT